MARETENFLWSFRGWMEMGETGPLYLLDAFQRSSTVYSYYS